MDVYCTACAEPWDAYHLRQDAIFETDLSREEAEAWRGLSRKERLSTRYREKFKAAGYEFGSSVFIVLHCPACPPGAKPDPEKAAIKGSVALILGDDEDGLAAALEDLGL